MHWRTVDGSDIAPNGELELETVIKGVFEKTRFLTLVWNFTMFKDTESGLVKTLAGYHQFIAVRQAVENIDSATCSEGETRSIGVILAYTGLWQEPAYGLLRWTDHRPSSDGEFDRCLHH